MSVRFVLPSHPSYNDLQWGFDPGVILGDFRIVSPNGALCGAAGRLSRACGLATPDRAAETNFTRRSSLRTSTSASTATPELSLTPAPASDERCRVRKALD